MREDTDLQEYSPTREILSGQSVKCILAGSILVCIVVLGVTLFSGLDDHSQDVYSFAPEEMEIVETGLSRMGIQMVELNKRLDAQSFTVPEKRDLNETWISLDEAWTALKEDQDEESQLRLNKSLGNMKSVLSMLRRSVKSEVGDSRELDVQYVFFYIDGLSDNVLAMERFLQTKSSSKP